MSTRTMGSTETKAKRPKRRSRSTAGDAFVVLAMTLTTVALAIGLYLQFRLAFWLAVVAALSVYVGLLALHVLVRRSERVEHLTAEIQRLEAELSQAAGQTASQTAGTSRAGPGTVAAAASGGTSSSSTQNQSPSNTGTPNSGIGTMPPRQGPSAPPPVPAGGSLQPAARDLPQADIRPRGEPMPGRTPQPAADAPPALADKPATAAEAAERGGPGGRAGMTDRAVDAIMNDYWAFRPSQPPRLPEPGAAAGQLGTPPAVPPAVATLPPPVPATPPPMPSSPRQSDVEMIGGLIKKMADEINAVESGRLRNPAGGDRVPPAAIEASVNALRTTADQMRGAAAPPPEPLRTPPMSAPPLLPQPKPTDAGHDSRLPSAPPPASGPGQRPRPPEAAQVWDDAAKPARDHSRDNGRDAAPARPVHGAMPPPLPASAPPLPQALEPQQSAPPPVRHAMSRPAARALPPHDDAARFTAMPWSVAQDTGVDTDAGPAMAPAAMAPAASDARRGPAVADIAPPPPMPSPAPVPAAPVQSAATPPAIGHSRLAALAEAITAGRLDVLLDPILGLADQRARHYEVSVRLRDKSGNVLEPPDGVPELRESGLLPLLDCARIHKSAQVASRLADRGKPGSLFSAFSGESLAHDQFLSDFADLYAAREGLSAQLVLSFGQADVRAFAGRDWDTVAEMRELGFRFALQSVTDLDFDLEALKAAGFDFVKLDASVFLDGMPASGGVIPAADICRHLAQLGMTLIVGEIEDQAQLARIFGFGVIYGQGQLFGGARPMKSEALAGAGHAAA